MDGLRELNLNSSRQARSLSNKWDNRASVADRRIGHQVKWPMIDGILMTKQLNPAVILVS